jgi:hypothetical protein
MLPHFFLQLLQTHFEIYTWYVALGIPC